MQVARKPNEGPVIFGSFMKAYVPYLHESPKDGAFKIWNYSLLMPKSDGLIVTAPASYMSQHAFDAKFSMNSWECCLS